MIGASNMAPGADHDPRSGCDDDTIFCPESHKYESACHYCGGLGMISERHYNEMKEQEREETEANQ